MRDFLRNSLLNSFSLFTVSSFYPALIIPDNLKTLVWAGIVFTLINYLIKPIVKLLLLPINLITLGVFRWVGNVLVLMILVRVIDTINITSLATSSFSQAGFTIPPLNINQFFSYILVSFLLSLVFNIFNQIVIED